MLRRPPLRFPSAPRRRLPAFLAACLAAGACAGLTAQEDPAADARLFARAGEYDLAAETWREVLEERPGDVAAVQGLARALVAIGRYEPALTALRESPAFEDSAALRAAEGRILLRIGALRDAESAFRAALTVDPENVHARCRLGEVLADTGRRDEARDHWRRIVRFYQEMSIEEAEAAPAETYVEMGVALRHLNRYHDANEVMFPQAKDQDPECLSLWVEWGRTFLEKYDFPFSRRLLRRGLEINPYLADAQVLLAENYLLDFQVGTERYDLATKQIERALETNPRHPGAFTARGSLWLTDGRLDRAVEDFRSSLEIRPTDARTLGLLAACWFLMGSHEEEFAEVEKRALEVNPQSGEFYHTIALAIERRFRYEEAAEFSAKALELNPEYWRAYHTLGINYLRTGREKEGRRYLEKSYEEDPFNVWVVNTRKLLRHVDKEHREYSTERFRFRFPSEDYEVLKSLLVPLLEDAYDTLSARYEVELDPPVWIDVFSKHQWFSARIVGLGGFPATGACFGNVVALTTPKALPQNWGAVAWHEFAHVVTLEKTKNRVPRWLTEGISVFEEGYDRPKWARNFQRQIADAHGSDRLLSIGKLDSGFSKPRYPMQVLISYYQGCLVVQYITETRTFDKVLDLLDAYGRNLSTARAFQEALGVTLEEFDQEFFAWLDEWVEATGYRPQVAEENIPRLQIELEENPEDVRRRVELAWAYYCAGNRIDAPITANRALEADPDSGDAQAVLGLSFLRDEKPEKAREHLQKALQSGTEFEFRVHAALGRIAEEEGERDEAIRHFTRAKDISPRAGAAHPSGANLYYRLAGLHEKAGDEARAISVLEELRTFATEDPRCRQMLAQHYLADGGEASARRAFEVLEEILYIQPFDRGLRTRLAEVAARLGEHEVTLREYGFLLEFPDTNPATAHLAMARAARGLGRDEEAARHAREVLRVDPGNSEAEEILEALGEPAAETGAEG